MSFPQTSRHIKVIEFLLAFFEELAKEGIELTAEHVTSFRKMLVNVADELKAEKTSASDPASAPALEATSTKAEAKPEAETAPQENAQ